MPIQSIKSLWLFLMLFLAANSSFAQAYRSKIVAGNKLYTEEKYDESLNKYRDAQVQAPESPIIKFNIGDAQYKKKNFDEALKEFESSLTSDDVLMQAKTYYNMGNSLYRQGKLPESIQAYKKSLELKPDDEDAKYNLEFVRKQLKDQAQKQQQNPQQQQQQNQQQQNQQQNDQKQQDQDKKEQEQQKQQQQQEQQQQQQPSKEDISKEDAQRILDALKEDEKEMKDARKQQTPGNPYVTKDW
jgi:Ca-activated chloride channel family protein